MPVAQKVADEVVFRRFQGEGVEFFLNRTSLTPSQIFDANYIKICYDSDGFKDYPNE